MNISPDEHILSKMYLKSSVCDVDSDGKILLIGSVVHSFLLATEPFEYTVKAPPELF